MKLKKTTMGGIAATLLFAVGCGSGGGGPATGGSGGTAGSGEGGKATGGSGGSATGGSGTGGATGGAGGATGGAGGATGGATGGAGGAGGATGGAGGATGGAGGATGGAGGGGVGGTAWLTPPTVPPALAVPLGATLAIHDHGTGVQIYTCTPGGGAGGGAGSGADAGAVTYSWVLKGPDAKLYDANNVQVGTHGIGPEWTSIDGSIVNGTKVEQANAPSMTPAAIPWLLLRGSTPTGGTTGVFTNVTYVQRVSTTGGAAPATGCDASTSGTDTSVAYTAEYYFYTGGGVAAWLTPPANIPTALAVPSGSALAIHDHGVGTQIYTCTASGGAGGAGGAAGSGADAGAITYSWVLKGPNAILSDADFAQVGTHGVGPTWTSSDGSMISGTKVAQAAGSASDAVPWLLLKATSTGGAGVFANITSVQRLNTAGGVAPATGCGSTTVSSETSVNYSADYYFYTGGTGG